MRKLDQRGMAALEFALAAVPLFTIFFMIFDLGRYAITLQSLHALADAGARAVMVNCYTPDALNKVSPSGCTSPSDPLSASGAKQAIAPFLYLGGLTPTLSVTTSTSGASHSLVVTASQSAFTMLIPIWGSALNAPSASASIPY
jgi:Flp pilus assembly protein TadG